MLAATLGDSMFFARCVVADPTSFLSRAFFVGSGCSRGSSVCPRRRSCVCRGHRCARTIQRGPNGRLLAGPPRVQQLCNDNRVTRRRSAVLYFCDRIK